MSSMCVAFRAVCVPDRLMGSHGTVSGDSPPTFQVSRVVQPEPDTLDGEFEFHEFNVLSGVGWRYCKNIPRLYVIFIEFIEFQLFTTAPNA